MWISISSEGPSDCLYSLCVDLPRFTYQERPLQTDLKPSRWIMYTTVDLYSRLKRKETSLSALEIGIVGWDGMLETVNASREHISISWRSAWRCETGCVNLAHRKCLTGIRTHSWVGDATAAVLSDHGYQA